MPTYSYQCDACGAARDVWQSIGAYMRTPEVPQCCGAGMARRITHTAPLGVSEAHYTGLRAADGTDISSRAKHRAYMRKHGLTTADDYTGQWQRAAAERRAILAGDDASRKEDIARAFEQVQRQDR